ncbi:MAG: VWA domain-containing protein [Bdellovibrionales bacterium]|nr:VWA domain-containing protein [Bdellovibrionales bacterium]
MKVAISSVLALTFLSACGDPRLLYYRNPPAREIGKQVAAVREMENGGKVDIVFVVDNSGSMGSHQQRLIQSTDDFMNEFLRKGSKFDWRIGVISSDVSESPYLGFTRLDRCDVNSVDPKRQFQKAVGFLGTSGDATEQFLEPLTKHLKGNDFLRKRAFLAIFFMTDTYEQSANTVQNYYQQLVNLVGEDKRILPYGAFASDDTAGCANEGWNWGSTNVEYRRWREFFNLRGGGKRYDLCQPDLGKQMADFAKDLIEKVDNPKILLKERPVPYTIRVSYEGEELLGGRASDKNAIWYYDYALNAIVFRNMDKFPDDTSKVEVTFEIDDGRPETT